MTERYRIALKEDTKSKDLNDANLRAVIIHLFFFLLPQLILSKPLNDRAHLVRLLRKIIGSFMRLEAKKEHLSWH